MKNGECSTMSVSRRIYACQSIYVSALINFQMNIHCLLCRNNTSNIYISKWVLLWYGKKLTAWLGWILSERKEIIKQPQEAIVFTL